MTELKEITLPWHIKLSVRFPIRIGKRQRRKKEHE